MSLKILIVEDELSIAKRIQRLTKEIVGSNLASMETRQSVNEALEYIKKNNIDLLFLDLNLSGANGFDVLKRVLAESFETVIISAYREKAIEAFEYGVSDFVPKPFTKERLEKAIDRVLSNQRIEDHQVKRIVIKKQGSVQLIPVSQIRYIQGANIYSEIYLENGKKELSNKSLDILLKILPTSFERIHKSYIVDMGHASELLIQAGSKYLLRMNNGDELPVGRTKYKHIKSNYFS